VTCIISSQTKLKHVLNLAENVSCNVRQKTDWVCVRSQHTTESRDKMKKNGLWDDEVR